MKRILLFLLLFAAPALAVEPSEMMADPVLESRAREVSKSLRCVVCQNETIDESNAELAHDMRLMVRRRIAAGDSNPEVLHYMVQRYGDFVLLKPRFMPMTLVLWLGPLIVLVLGGVVVTRVMRRASLVSRAPAVPLTSDEAAALAKLDPEP